MDYRWYKKEKVCKDDDEYDAFKEAKKGMRGLKTIDFKVEEK